MAAARNMMVAMIMVAGGVLASCGDPPPKEPVKPSESAPTPPAKPVDTKPTETKPTDSKPAEAKPSDTKPTEPKPTTETPKDRFNTPANLTLPIEKVTISGNEFKLEVANTEETRYKGLSGRASIPADGGMLFVFPARGVQTHGFVMRDCPVPIDIIYLDASGRIVAMHKMVPEPPRTEKEKVLTRDPRYPEWTASNTAYETRLRQYSSGFPSQYVIELAGNTLDSLNLKAGQKIELAFDRLKKAAK